VSVSEESLAAAESVIGRSTDSAAHLALLGDKHLLFSERRNAFIMYGISGRSWVAMGDPIGPPTEFENSPGTTASAAIASVPGPSSTR